MMVVYNAGVVTKWGNWRSEFIRRAATDDFPIFEPYYKLDRKYKDMLWHGLPSERRLLIFMIRYVLMPFSKWLKRISTRFNIED